ncbi:S8/S53 family peptidase [Actinocrispum sp. NPDC049592]|uniref:S8 family peptidase n=1 Tax=Actinocrispum sp. NPDC049592 TaxID=3154835 RepID=UPI00343A6EF4
MTTVRFDLPEDGQHTSTTFVPQLPQWVLDRYGAKVLDPAEVTPPPGYDLPMPQPAIYRTGVLTLPLSMFSKGDLLGKVDALLGTSTIRQPDPEEKEGRLPDPVVPEGLGGLTDEQRGMVPVPVPLNVRGEQPGKVDAAAAVQAIRLAERRSERARARKEKEYFTEEEQQQTRLISLEYLFAGTDLQGVPTYSPHDIRDPNSGSAGLTYQLVPVVYHGPQPQRSQPKSGARRPVVAMIDSGVAPHKWFGLDKVGAMPQGGFLRDFPQSTQAIQAQQAHLGTYVPTEILTNGYIDGPMYCDDVTEQIGPGYGHGTAIAGILHQLAPDADVLVIRALQASNVATHADLVLALWLLVARVRAAQQPGGTMTDMVDIVTLSMGDYVADDKPAMLEEAIRALAGLGVLVVAAAGNDSTSRPFYPAALCDEIKYPSWTGPRVIGVGATNPNGSTAWFANGGRNATCQASGAFVVTTFPRIDGPLGPSRVTKTRQGVDLDTAPSSFAAVCGTSMAAPHIAGLIARKLWDNNSSYSLADIGVKATMDRIEQAVCAVKKDVHDEPDGL